MATVERMSGAGSGTKVSHGHYLSTKLIGSRFRVQACPGAAGCGYDIVFAFYGLVFPSPHLDMPGLGQGFKGYNILISVTLYSIVWIGRFNLLGETWNSTQLTRNTIIRDQLWHFNWEP